MKKVLIKFLFLVLLLNIGISVHAAIIDGECGTGIAWSYDTTTYTLEIAGNGAMNDYTSDSDGQPWSGTSYTSRIDTLIINEGITYIGNYAFSSLSGLETVTLPNTLQTIGSNAFEACTSLSDIEIPSNLTGISGNAFKNCINLERIELSSNISTLGDGIFKGCVELKNVLLPGNITIIPTSTFDGCTSLETIKLPQTVTTIKGGAFKSCSNLKNIIIPDGIQMIQNNAFNSCTSLKDIVLTNNTITLAPLAFSSCSNLTIHCNTNSTAHTFAENKGFLSATLPTQFTVTSSVTDNTISIKATVPTTTFDKYIHVALYDSDHRFIGYESLPSTSFCGVFNIDVARTEDISYAKVFAWNDENTLKPFAENEMITLVNENNNVASYTLSQTQNNTVTSGVLCTAEDAAEALGGLYENSNLTTEVEFNTTVPVIYFNW